MITYQHEAFIREAIEGVLMQEVDFSIDLLIADDASPDSTGLIVQEYIDNHPKGHWIRYVRHSENKGMMANFVWAMGQCNGNYIALCEGDDYWTDPLKIKKQILFLEANPNFSFSFHDCVVVDEQSQIIANSYLPKSSKKNLNFTEIGLNRLIPTCSVIINRKSLPTYFPEEFLFTNNGDTFLFFLLSFYGSAYFHDDILSSSYRIQKYGVWSNLSEINKVLKILNTYYLLIKIAKPNKYKKIVNKKISHLSYKLGKEYSSSNRSISTYFFHQSIIYSIKSFQFEILFYSLVKLI